MDVLEPALGKLSEAFAIALTEEWVYSHLTTEEANGIEIDTLQLLVASLCAVRGIKLEDLLAANFQTAFRRAVDRSTLSSETYRARYSIPND